MNPYLHPGGEPPVNKSGILFEFTASSRGKFANKETLARILETTFKIGHFLDHFAFVERLSMPSSRWLFALLSAMTSLGLLTCRTCLVMAQEEDDKQPTVIILKLEKSEITSNEEPEQEQDEKEKKAKRGRDEDDDDDDEKEMKDKEDQEGDDEKDDKESKSKKKQPKQAKAKKEKAAKKPKEHAEEHRPEKPRKPEPPREERSRPDRPERGFQFRWEGEGPRPPQREEGRGGPPEEIRRQMEAQRAQMERQRDELRRHADEMRAQAERMRREVEERARHSEQTRDQHQQVEQKNRALAEHLKATEQQLAQRTQEVHKLKIALQDREKVIIELKNALAKQGAVNKPQPKPVAKAPMKVADEQPIDPALIARVERLEAEIRRLMAILKQQAQPKPERSPDTRPPLKIQVTPEIKVDPAQATPPVVGAPVQGVITLNVVPSVHPGDAPPSIKVVSPGGAPVIEKAQEVEVAPPPNVEQPKGVVVPKAAATVPDGGTLTFGGGTKVQITPKVVSPSGVPMIEKPTSGEIPPPTPLPDPEPQAEAPKPANIAPNPASAVGGVGVVEGEVVALLPQEGKFVLRVSTWHDGKQVRADWVGQQVSINQGALPALKPGDHIAIDARIDAQKGFVWGGKVFQTK